MEMSEEDFYSYIPLPPDGGYGWVVMLASFFNHVIIDGITFSLHANFQMEFVEIFGINYVYVSLVGSLLLGFYLFTGPVASALVNKFGCRTVCMFGSLLSTIGFFLASFATNIVYLMLTYGFLSGIGFGFMYLPSIVSVSYYFEKKRAIATGVAVCGAGVGGFAFAPMGRVLLEYYDWRNALRIVSGITLQGLIFGMLMRPLEPPKRRKPRKKNFIDRLREQASSTNISKHSDESENTEDVKSNKQRLEKVKRVKLAREERLHDDESDGGSFRERISSFGPKFSFTKTSPRRLQPIVSASEDIEDESAKAEPEGIDDSAKLVSNSPNAQEENKTLLAKKEETKSLRKQLLEQKSTDSDALMKGSCPDLANHNVNMIKPILKTQGYGNKLHPKDSRMHPLTMNFAAPNTVRRLDKNDLARPLYRRDIFYSGSVYHISRFRSAPNMKAYVKSITEIPEEVPSEKEWKCCKCIPKAVKDILKAMLDPSLLKNPVFFITLCAEFLGFIGLFIPFVFVTERAISLDLPKTEAALLLSAIGVANTVGRILAGFLAYWDKCNPLVLHNVMMIVGGVACLLNKFAVSYVGMLFFSIVFGLSVATYISLTSIILCNQMGLEKLTSAFGFLTCIRGIASIGGPPLAGYVFEKTGSFDMCFYLGGGLFLASGAIFCLLHLPCLQQETIDFDFDFDFLPDPPPVSSLPPELVLNISENGFDKNDDVFETSNGDCQSPV